MKKSIHFIALLLSAPFLSNAQVDTQFWFAAPEVSATIASFDGKALDRPVKLHLTSGGDTTKVKISQPSNGMGMPEQNIVIIPNSTVTVDLSQWIDLIETKPPNAVLNTGIRIESSAPIGAYYNIEHVANPESFTLKGSKGLGIDFWIPSQNIMDNGAISSPTASSSFDIVASADSTIVTIKPSNDIIGHAANTTFSIVLNKGQTWSAQAIGIFGVNHLGGSYVTSDKPIAITIKDDMLDFSFGSGYDLIGDQILPTSMLGKEYIAIKGELAYEDKIFIIAAENNTSIHKNGSLIGSINAGETYQLSFSVDSAVYIKTSGATAVFHVSGLHKELGAKQLIPLQSSKSKSVSYKRMMNNELYLGLVVTGEGRGSFKINDTAIDVSEKQFSLVDGTADYWYAKVNLTNSVYLKDSIITVENGLTGFQMSIWEGWEGWGANYAYFAGFDTSFRVPIGIGSLVKRQDLKLFPNPADDVIYIEGDNVESISIFNAIGQRMDIPLIKGENIFKINTTSLSPGNYFINVTTKYSSKNYRIVVL